MSTAQIEILRKTTVGDPLVRHAPQVIAVMRVNSKESAKASILFFLGASKAFTAHHAHSKGEEVLRSKRFRSHGKEREREI